MGPAETGTKWTEACGAGELAAGSMRAVKKDGEHLLLGRDAEGALFAVEGRCPHEGYPLVQGKLAGQTLTCCWHNWKFDVRDGACLLGGEGLRSYPVRECGGRIEVDLRPPSVEELAPTLLASLAEGLRDHDLGRSLRDVARLLQLGLPVAGVLAEVARYDALHAEYGSTHVLALAEDMAAMAARTAPEGGTDALATIAPVIDLAGESDRRLDARERPEPSDAPSAEGLRAAVEAQDVALAEAQLRGAFRAGIPRAEIESWLLAVSADHFTGFGHDLIYLRKSVRFCGRIDERFAEDLYAGWIVGRAYATREDELPYMRGYFERLANRSAAPQELSAQACRDAVLDGSIDEALQAVLGPLEAGTPPATVARHLVGAAAHRLLRFDVALDSDPLVAEHWLFATHRLTFASAVRDALDGAAPAELARRLLVQVVAFVHSGRAMDAPPATRHRPVAGGACDAGGIVEAVLGRDAGRAVDGVAALVAARRGHELRAPLDALLLAVPAVRPIVLAHVIKTTLTAFEELEALAGHPDRGVPLQAAVRFLASPVQESRLGQATTTALRWVRDGEMPRKLTQ